MVQTVHIDDIRVRNNDQSSQVNSNSVELVSGGWRNYLIQNGYSLLVVDIQNQN